MANEQEIDAGPCLICGHPPRCHPEQECDSSMYTTPCGNYIPDPAHIIKVKAPGGINA